MKKKKIETIFKVIPIFIIILYIVCFGLYFITNNQDNVRRATVTEVKEKTLKVEIGDQLGDPIIYEIPKDKKYEINDIIYVKINNQKVHKTINPELLLTMPFLICLLVYIAFAIVIIILPIIEVFKVIIKPIKGNN